MSIFRRDLGDWKRTFLIISHSTPSASTPWISKVSKVYPSFKFMMLILTLTKVKISQADFYLFSVIWWRPRSKKICRCERRESNLGNHELQPRKQGRLCRLCLSSKVRKKMSKFFNWLDQNKKKEEQTPHGIIVWKCILQAHILDFIRTKEVDFF